MANDNKLDELDWIHIREELDGDYKTETIYEKAVRKTRENPLVPIGTFATTLALTYGLYNFYHGRRQMQQYMMRARVGAQAFTIICIVAGFILMPKKQNKQNNK
ncbi:PREDICTED: HIG1 domain family member 2A, mitochondrial [Dinoponera quadriceps]|uniref:HIG1 domain family member 2A, mitochondrial n=1 Tax=Dinoponera quadriceps TaxID=609295 RepID=A0A6P3XBH1_DINQU|nr:PREDICTED: HIG1 domain family member 2A, mitochondrial [Dinoponera quadriceps]